MKFVHFSKKHKYIAAVAGGIFFILLIVGNIIAAKYKAIIQRTLPVAVAEATDSLYHISVKRVSINLLNRRITLRGVHIEVDSAIMRRQKLDSSAKKNYYDIKIPRLQISGIMWDKLTGGEGYSCAEFSLKNPQITIVHTPKALTRYRKVKKRAAVKDFSAGEVVVNNATIKYISDTADTTRQFTFSRCHILLNNWLYNQESLQDSSRVLLAQSAIFKIGKFLFYPPGSFYQLSVENITYTTESDKLTAANLKYLPRIPEDECWKRMPEQKELYSIVLPTIELAGINREKLLYYKELHIDAIYLNNSEIKIAMNRLLPENTKSKMGRFPNQLIQKIKMPLAIKNVVLNNGKITYAETSEKTGKTASIVFEKLDGTIKNITNIQQLVINNSSCIAQMECKLNNKTDVQAMFNLSLADSSGAFSAGLKIHSLQGRQISEQTKAFSLLEVRSLNMKSLELQVSGNEHAAEGKFKMHYSNLGIKMLKDTSKLPENQKRKGLISFIANNMILYSANPMPGEALRTVNTYVERDQSKSFFNLVWKNILYGVRETTIRDMDVIRWLQKNEQKQQQKPPQDKKRKKIFNRNEINKEPQ